MLRNFPWCLAAWNVLWVALVFGLDRVIRHYSLYYVFQLSDKLMHILAGVAIGTFGWVIIQWRMPNISSARKLATIIGLALVVGIGWEILERFYSLLNPRIMQFDLRDSVLDVCAGLFGGIISFTYRSL